MLVRQVIYSSKAVEPFSELELGQLLLEARRKNSAVEVSGMLLYHEGAFLQVLEGPVSAVEAIFSRIERDPRHYRLFVLQRLDVGAREFPDWSMGFVSVNRGLLGQLSGYRDVFVQGFSEPNAGGVARGLLRTFREQQWRKLVDS